MEVAIPLVALGGLYIVSNQNRNRENFQQQKYEGKLLTHSSLALVLALVL